jgi:hypothetical protein
MQRLSAAVAAYNEAKVEGGPALGSAQRELGGAKRLFDIEEARSTYRVLSKSDVVVSTTIGNKTIKLFVYSLLTSFLVGNLSYLLIF